MSKYFNNDALLKPLLADAFVRGNSLDCYEWEPEEKLKILFCIEELAENENAFLVYNCDKNEFAIISTSQLICINKNIKFDCLINGNPKTYLFTGSSLFIENELVFKIEDFLKNN